MRAHLEQKGVPSGPAGAAVERMVQDGYLGDARFALMFVSDRRQLDGWGSDRIRRALAGRGVDREQIECALAQDESERAGGQSELERALELLCRRCPSPPRERRERDRALGMLLRKGFDGEVALDALGRYARPA
jgi:regulatory protein